MDFVDVNYKHLPFDMYIIYIILFKNPYIVFSFKLYKFKYYFVIKN